MGSNFVIDTNIAIYILAGRTVENLPEGDHLLSAVTLIELLGFRGLSNEARDQVETLISGAELVHVDEPLARLAASIRARTNLKVPDSVVVATAKQSGAVLLTSDAKIIRSGEVPVQTMDLLF